jgi:hypothetical protein
MRHPRRERDDGYRAHRSPAFPGRRSSGDFFSAELIDMPMRAAVGRTGRQHKERIRGTGDSIFRC